MSRIDRDRDVVIVPDKESLPGAIADRTERYTHAYPEDFRMNRGDVKIFGPKKAAPVQTVAVLDMDSESMHTDARIKQDDAILLPNGQERSARHVKNYTHAYPENFRMRLTSSMGSDVKIIGPRKSHVAPPAVTINKEAQAEQTNAAIALAADVELEETEAEVRRSWADEEEDEETPQHVLVNQW